MLATLAGLLALVAGLVPLLLPLLIPELSRQRDAVWGAVVLLLGLTLVTSSERLVGSPMLAVLCGTLLIGRLSVEVSQSRWRALSPDERQALTSRERWQTSLQQLLAAGARLTALALELRQLVMGRFGQAKPAKSGGKRWIRPETAAPETSEAPQVPEASEASETTPDTQEPPLVSSLSEVDALIQASADNADAATTTGEAG
ncbi:MAG: hypothetical protein EBZ51_13560 [Synechococcaceae bacterium WB9_2_112]|nr:hypothetical protein [Synechococcaceae bacterium WB9_2_112]